MSATPQHSRTTSRSSTPALTLFSNEDETLHPPISRPVIQSFDSMATLDNAEGILISGHDEGEDTDDASVVFQPNDNTDADEAKRNLRAQLRRTLTTNSPCTSPQLSKARDNPSIDQVVGSVQYAGPREYFVLTEAGKPVYASIQGESTNESLSTTLGVVQALISVFIDDTDKLRCVNAGSTRITFLLRPPLYYVCVSSWGEPESITRTHLEYLHLQILSLITATQLRRIFERRTNFDLRRMLNGAESLLSTMIERLQLDVSMSSSSLYCAAVDASLRKRAGECLVPDSSTKDLLYILLIVNGKVLTLIRPKRHSIHPADIHILMNTVYAPSVVESPAPTSWIPVCLPKFNSSGHLNAYITFVRNGESGSTVPIEPDVDRAEPDPPSHRRSPLSDLVLVAVSAGIEFELIRKWGDSAVSKLGQDGTLETLKIVATDYSVAELGIPGLRHFIYKARSQVQITMPLWEGLYEDIRERQRLVTLYQLLHDNIHAKSGQESGLKLQYIKSDKECMMGWITQPFEIYLTMSPLLPKSAVVNAANAVTRWVRREEGRLFLTNAPTF